MMIRYYYSRPNADSEIAAEVIKDGMSMGWVGELAQAKEIEQTLARYNIGYINDLSGMWGYVIGGTKFFQ